MHALADARLATKTNHKESSMNCERVISCYLMNKNIDWFVKDESVHPSRLLSHTHACMYIAFLCYSSISRRPIIQFLELELACKR